MRTIPALLIIISLTLPQQSWGDNVPEEHSTVSQESPYVSRPEPDRIRSPGKLAVAASTMVAGGVLIGVGLNQIDKSEHNYSWNGVGNEFVGQLFVGVGAASLVTSIVFWALYARGEVARPPSATISLGQNGSRTMLMTHYRF
jgi:hypothetical protein